MFDNVLTPLRVHQYGVGWVFIVSLFHSSSRLLAVWLLLCGFRLGSPGTGKHGKIEESGIVVSVGGV